MIALLEKLLSLVKGKPARRAQSMAYNGVREVEVRLAAPEPLTEQEMLAMTPWLGTLAASAMRRFEAEAVLANIHAIRQFEKSSRRQGLLNLGVSIALFVLSVIAIVIALKSYHAANDAAKHQQATLEATGTAIEKSATVLSLLATTVQEQWSRQVAIEGRKPQIEATVNATAPNGSPIDVKLSEKTTRVLVSEWRPQLSFVLRNIGDAPLVKPVYVFTANPSSIGISCGGQFLQGLQGPNLDSCQINDAQPIYPFAQSALPRSVDLGFTMPGGVGAMELKFKVAGENISARTFRLRVIQSRNPR